MDTRDKRGEGLPRACPVAPHYYPRFGPLQTHEGCGRAPQTSLPVVFNPGLGPCRHTRCAEGLPRPPPLTHVGPLGESSLTLCRPSCLHCWTGPQQGPCCSPVLRAPVHTHTHTHTTPHHTTGSASWARLYCEEGYSRARDAAPPTPSEVLVGSCGRHRDPASLKQQCNTGEQPGSPRLQYLRAARALLTRPLGEVAHTSRAPLRRSGPSTGAKTREKALHHKGEKKKRVTWSSWQKQGCTLPPP